MSSTPTIYLKHKRAIKDLPTYFQSERLASLSNKWLFVGIDLAPVDGLETGVAVLNPDRTLLHMSKLSTDRDILHFLANLGAPENMIIALDLPKSLSIDSRWRQQQIKMHPFTLQQDLILEADATPKARYAQRAKNFYDAARKRNHFIVGFFATHAKIRYPLTIPFRNRSPHGCRATQVNIREVLGIQNLPSNLAPSSVLDGVIAAYTGWLLCKGAEEKHFQLYEDDEARLYLDPLQKMDLPASKERKRRRRMPGAYEPGGEYRG
jgi:hypothetical protein